MHLSRSINVYKIQEKKDKEEDQVSRSFILYKKKLKLKLVDEDDDSG